MRSPSQTNSAPDFDPRSNRILAQLPINELEELLPHFECLPLKAKYVLVHPNVPIRSVYFPLDSVSSLINKDNDDHKLEVGLTGRDGMIGYPLLLGVDSIPQEIFIQIPGQTLQMDAEVFVAACNRNAQLRTSILRFSQAMYNQVTQAALCNNIHTMEERLCRWLLMCRDRLDSNKIPLTQEFISIMLGVRRPTVTLVAGALQEAGFIDYTRGCITLLDREGLEESACECYGIIRDTMNPPV